MSETLTRDEVRQMMERNWSPDAWENMTSTTDELFTEAVNYIQRLGEAYLELLDSIDGDESNVP